MAFPPNGLPSEAEQEKIEGKGNVPVISDGMTMIPSCGVDVSCFADWSAHGCLQQIDASLAAAGQRV